MVLQAHICAWSNMYMSMRASVLGLLDLEPMTGYDLKKAFDETIGHFWAGDQSQVYRTLSTLVAEGSARVEVVQQDGKPNRKLHHLTDQGRTELQEWLASPLEPEPVRDTFLARVFFAGRLDTDQIRGILTQRRNLVLAKVATLEAIHISDPPSDTATVLRMATLRHGLAHLRTELAWLDHVEGLLP